MGSLIEGGPVAQLVERVLCKHDVIGSTPFGSTKIKKPPASAGGFFIFMDPGSSGSSVLRFFGSGSSRVVVGHFKKPIKNRRVATGSDSSRGSYTHKPFFS
jgi:hypothetical protein